MVQLKNFSRAVSKENKSNPGNILSPKFNLCQQLKKTFLSLLRLSFLWDVMFA